MMADGPFLLLDDARGAGAIRLYERPAALFVAYRPGEVEATLEQARAAQAKHGGTLAGYLAYEAGLALEPALHALAERRTGAGGPLVWFGRFEEARTLLPAGLDEWLAERADGAAALGPLDPQLSEAGYAAALAKLTDRIEAGDLYQANLTFPLSGAYRGNPVALYAALRDHARAGHGALLFDGTHWTIGLSPELLVEGDGMRAQVRPMKGTRARQGDAQADAAAARALADAPKDRAELLMIVDLMRNDLARIAQAGSVRVDEAFTVESFPTVHQMVTGIGARLRPGTGPLELLRALFPAGSITGAPKIAAIRAIDALERDARGPYCGAFGRIEPDGSLRFNVAIRTMRLTPTENGHGTAVLGVGGAVLAESDPLTERREAVLKGGFARAAAASGADLIETMRFTPDEGIALLDGHLARIRRSAQTLGYTFDHHAARNQIQALCFDLDAPARVRLMASRRGAIVLEAAPLPAPWPDPVPCIALPLPIDPGDWRLMHKTTDRGFYEDGRAAALKAGALEAIFVDDAGCPTEGTYSTIFVMKGERLVTPSAARGLLPGVLRASLLARGEAEEGAVTLDDLADGFFIGNALRGLKPARLLLS